MRRLCRSFSAQRSPLAWLLTPLLRHPCTHRRETEKQEQQALRAEYIADFRKSLKSQLDNTVVISPDGTSYRLRQDKGDK